MADSDKKVLEIPTGNLGRDTVVLIVWNRETGNYKVDVAGHPLHIQSAEVLLEQVFESLKRITNDVGIVKGHKGKPDPMSLLTPKGPVN
jgi:hypothetical protein